MPQPSKTNGMPHLKRRIDRSEAATEYNKVVQAVQMVAGAGKGDSIPISVGRHFTHFQIATYRDGAQWKGYVGNGLLLCTEAATIQNLWHIKEPVDANLIAVEHNGEEIQLDVEELPWGTGIRDLIDADAGVDLDNDQLYYVYLKITSETLNLIQSDVTQLTPISTVILENVTDIETSFETEQKDVVEIDPYTDDSIRYYLLGVINTPVAAGNACEIAQISHHAIYLPPVYRGRELSSSGLGETETGSIENTGVLTIAQGNGIILSATTGDVTIDNDGVISATGLNEIDVDPTTGNIVIDFTG